MLDKISKLEEKLNNTLLKIVNLFLLLIHKIISPVVFRKCSRAKKNILGLFASLKDLIKGYSLRALWVSKEFLSDIVAIFDKIQKYPLKSQVFLFLKNIRDSLLNTPLRSYVLLANKVLEKFSRRFENAISILTSQQFVIAFSALCMILIGTYNIYVSSEDIYQKEFTGRVPASADKYLDRPEYRKYAKRTMKVFNVRVPIFVENVKQIKSVTIDFSVRTSTRFARYFLESYEYKLKDYFFMTVEPVISSFPIETEGKLILKEKIQDELNNFLKEQNVEGEVLEVDILFIVAS